MSTHAASPCDIGFRVAFEAGHIPPSEFNHLGHLRLAYVYLVEGGIEQGERQMREALLAFVAANHVPASNFHVTLTRAWLLAVWHFMNRRESYSFAEFAANSAPLLDSKVMLTHYSAETLYSAVARATFVEPDLEAIPV
ncbi:MAG: hypothetical protein ABIX37_05655 [Gammaproteobacteria bacterium]